MWVIAQTQYAVEQTRNKQSVLWFRAYRVQSQANQSTVSNARMGVTLGGRGGFWGAKDGPYLHLMLPCSVCENPPSPMLGCGHPSVPMSHVSGSLGMGTPEAAVMLGRALRTAGHVCNVVKSCLGWRGLFFCFLDVPGDVGAPR